MKYTINRWEIPPKNSKIHPAVFPNTIPYRLIKLFTCQEMIVLDPFAGSGTTGIIAKQLKRKAILVDISEDYCKIIVERLKENYLF